MNDINTCRTNTDTSNEANHFTCAGPQTKEKLQAKKAPAKKDSKNGQVKVKSCVRSETYGQFRLLLLLLHLQSRVPARV